MIVWAYAGRAREENAAECLRNVLINQFENSTKIFCRKTDDINATEPKSPRTGSL